MLVNKFWPFNSSFAGYWFLTYILQSKCQAKCSTEKQNFIQHQSEFFELVENIKNTLRWSIYVT